MLKVGLTGGIATGKSTVVSMLRELGAKVIDSDLLAKKAVEKGSTALDKIVEEFGRGILKKDGSLDRAALRDVIFGDKDARQRLNAIVHPFVQAHITADLKELSQNKHKIAFVDVPLLFEVGWQDRFDYLVLVYVPAQVQAKRLMKRDSLTLEQAQKALGAQLPIEEKVSKAQFLVDNQGSLEETREKVTELWNELLFRASTHHQPGNTEPS